MVSSCLIIIIQGAYIIKLQSLFQYFFFCVTEKKAVSFGLPQGYILRPNLIISQIIDHPAFEHILLK